ncbi:MAG TPA: permease-like cell division protein FtsX [Actinomycetota bacterium]
MRLEYYFRETASGLRRNGVVAFAAISTAFIALFLFGLALLIGKQLSIVIEDITRNVEVTIYLTDPVNPDTVEYLQTKLQDLEAVESAEFESKQEAYERFKELFREQQTLVENTDPATIPASLRVKLTDTAQYPQVAAAMGCAPDEETGLIVCTEPGVRQVRDYSALLDRLNTIRDVLRYGMLFVAIVMLVSAVLLVANTLRMGMFARRKEIGIMRLVGATNWRIRAPFLIEGLIESLIGAIFAVLFLFGLKVIAIDRLRGEVAFLPLVRNSDVMTITPWILLAAAAIAVIAGTVGMRRFLDV